MELVRYVKANFIIADRNMKPGFWGNATQDCDSDYAPAVLLSVAMEHGHDPEEVALVADIHKDKIEKLLEVDSDLEHNKSERYLTKKGLIYNAIRLATFAEKLERREALCGIR